MTSKLREIAESKGREFWVYKGIANCAPLLLVYDKPQKIKQLAPENFNEYHVSDQADKLAAALKVACDVIDLQRDALVSVIDSGYCEKASSIYAKCKNALADADKIMGEL